MTVYFKFGNIFDYAGEYAIVNPVNTVGVMGKGLALQFKKRYPEAYDSYKLFCMAGSLTTGRVKMVFVDRTTIFMFPTKEHWRNKSKLEWITAGLHDMHNKASKFGITKIAMPLVGAGLGGLRAQDVFDAIKHEFDNSSIEVVIVKYNGR